METAYTYLILSGVLTLLLWTPYILFRMVNWGLPAFLHNYPDGYPKQQADMPLWVHRSQRAHMNMIETLPAFTAVVLAAGYLATEQAGTTIGLWAQAFFLARIAHALVYTLGIPFLRTPTYLVSWAAILAIAATTLG